MVVQLTGNLKIKCEPAAVGCGINLKSLIVRPATEVQVVVQLTGNHEIKDTDQGAAGASIRLQKIIVWSETVAQLLAQLTADPEIEGSD